MIISLIIIIMFFGIIAKSFNQILKKIPSKGKTPITTAGNV